MECHYELKAGCLTISMPKELDHHSAEQLRMEADLLIDSYRVRSLVFDFCGNGVYGQLRHRGADWQVPQYELLRGQRKGAAYE